MRSFLLGIFSLFLIPILGWGQDVQYSQYYANPIYLNPAMVGSTSMSRVGFNFRNQWPALDQTFLAYTAYFDHYEERYNSGFSIIFQGANESFTETSWNEVGLGYSYRLQLSEDRFIQAGIQGSFITRDAYFGRVIFGSQLDINRGSIDLSGNGFAGESQVRDVDAHAGLVYYGKRAWLGASLGHLLSPDRSFSLGFNYKQQGQFSQLDLGTEFFFEPLALGLWYRGLPTKYDLPNHESLVAMLGVSLDSGLDVGYSFDFPISAYSLGRSGGSHELSVRYVFSSQSSGKKLYQPLPSFRY